MTAKAKFPSLWADMESVKKIWPWVSAILSGFLLSLCFPPYDSLVSPPPVNWLAWVALTPLLCAVWFGARWKRRRGLQCFLLGYCSGVSFFFTTIFWITTVSVEGWVALCLYLAAYPGVWAVFVGYCGTPVEKPGAEKSIWTSSLNNLRVAALCAAAWTAGEWIRGILISGFAWNGLGISLHANIAMIQVVSLTGVGGLSFLIVMVNVILVATINRLRMEARQTISHTGGSQKTLRPHYDFCVTFALIVLCLLYAYRKIALTKIETKPLSVTAVQGNIRKNFNWDDAFEQSILDTYTRLTETAILMKSDLLIWPEAAPPRSIFSDEHSRDVVWTFARKFDGDFLLGTLYFDGTGDYNSAALLTKRGEESQIYNKMHLVPFGEFLPFRNSKFPIFNSIAGALIPSDFTAGIEPQVFEMAKKPFKIGPLICFEDTLGSLARQFALRGAQLFVTITNDGWFQQSPESHQHLAHAVFRCAESGLPMVRSANTGVTCIIDRFGRVEQTLTNETGSTFGEGILFGEVQVPVNPEKTFYTRHGEVFSVLCLIVAGGSVLVVMARGRVS